MNENDLTAVVQDLQLTVEALQRVVTTLLAVHLSHFPDPEAAAETLDQSVRGAAAAMNVGGLSPSEGEQLRERLEQRMTEMIANARAYGARNRWGK